MAWAKALISDIANNKVKRLISTDNAVVIYDKFPKARHHFLVIPLEDINSIFELNRNHLPLLGELKLLSVNVVEMVKGDPQKFKMGFHAVPSMERLHVHVISTDFHSESLKTKKHWNSFNTSLFMPFDDVEKRIENEGGIRRLDKAKADLLLKSELRCNQCDFEPKNIPALKTHLADHYNKHTTK